VLVDIFIIFSSLTRRMRLMALNDDAESPLAGHGRTLSPDREKHGKLLTRAPTLNKGQEGQVKP
jgi:hypothetical protein